MSGPLLCFTSPLDLHAVQVVPDSPLQTDTDSPGSDPWLLQLANGQSCLFAQGGTAVLDNMRLNYSCGEGVVYGDPNRDNPVWTVLYQATGSNDLVPVGVGVAYS